MKLKITGLVLLYFIIFALIYGVLIINPFYTDWCLVRNPRLDVDIPINFLNGLAFFNSNAPIPLMDNNSFPDNIGVLYVDCIPLLAVILKMLFWQFVDTFANFQYAGIWGVLNFVLLGLLSFAFVKKFTKTSDLNAVLCSLFFVTAPIFLERYPRNYALSSMWLILLSFVPYVYYKKFEQKSVFFFYMILGIAATGIHTSYVPVIFINLCALTVYDYFKSRNKLFSIKLLGIYVISVFLTFLYLGGFGYMKQSALGYLYYTFNLAAFASPSYSFYNFDSVVLPFLNWLPKAYSDCHEGFAYLGAGIIILSFAIFFYLARLLPLKKYRDKFSAYIKKHNKEVLLFTLLFIFFIFFSSGTNTYFMDKTLFWNASNDNIFCKFYSIFRTPGRFIWEDVFIIYFAVLCFVLKVCKKKVATAIIAVCLLIQLIDLSQLLFNLHIDYALKKEYKSPIKSEKLWKRVARNKKICIIYDKDRDHTPSIYHFYYWGLKNKLKHNQMVYSRFNTDENEFVINRWIHPHRKDLFIFNGNHYGLIKNQTALRHCYKLDGYYACVKKPVPKLEQYKVELYRKEKNRKCKKLY